MEELKCYRTLIDGDGVPGVLEGRLVIVRVLYRNLQRHSAISIAEFTRFSLLFSSALLEFFHWSHGTSYKAEESFQPVDFFPMNLSPFHSVSRLRAECDFRRLSFSHALFSLADVCKGEPGPGSVRTGNGKGTTYGSETTFSSSHLLAVNSSSYSAFLQSSFVAS